MSITCSEVRAGAYYDSVVLMQLQKALADLPGVIDAGVVMGTPANHDLLSESDLHTPDVADAGPEDLIISVKAEDEDVAKGALAQVDAMLKQRRSQSSQAFCPLSLESAAKVLPQAQWVLVSVPGRYAARVARDALHAGKHVFLYSDNVSLQDEVELKQTAQEKGLLVLGPDCGTAIINGVGLGFANRVRRGNVGLVGASGTGLQAITSYIDQLGGGVSQAIGTGGRDLAAEVGGVTALQALDLLDRDPATAVIVLVSKPPAAQVATRLLAAAQAISKPVVVYFMGQPVTVRCLGNLRFAFNLKDAAEQALAATNQSPAEPEFEAATGGRGTGPKSQRRRYLRALFSGGTLAYEMMLGLQSLLTPLHSNVPLRDSQRLSNALRSQGHTVLDLGEDEFTQGRLHPMMDNALRIRRMRQEAEDPETGLILLDVVLGEGAHADPAAELAPVVAELTAKEIGVGVLLVGTNEDPQEMARQAEQFAEAGAGLYYDTAAVIEAVVATLPPPTEDALPNPVALSAFQKPLAAINLGLESFYESVRGQGAEAVHVSWRPPAGGNEKMMALLARLKG